MKKLFLIILLALAAALSAAAQDAKVRSFEAAPMDVTAQKHARLDLHGEKCAVVKVRVIADGVAFKGNLIGEPVENPGEYWVYLTGGTKQFQILSRSFLPFMYNFDEPLRGGVTYVLTLEAPQAAGAPVTPQRKKQNFLALKVTPPSAHVTVDGTEIALVNGACNKLLPAGTHTYRVTALGYAPHEETVTIADTKITRAVTLRSVMPRLTVTSATPGTEIFINDESRGTDRWNGELMPDTYVIEGRMDAYRTHSQTITLAEDETRTVAIPALTPITGSLTIDYLPQDATVTIDGRAVGTTPLLLDDLLVGSHKVTIAAEGYETKTLTATVAETTPATLSGTLAAKPTKPSLADIALTNNYESFKDPSTGKLGYKHNGLVVIPATFDWVGMFSEGLTQARIDGKLGYIDKTGTFVIPPKFRGSARFFEGLAAVTNNGKWGYIDMSGTMVIPEKYDDIGIFSEGLAKVFINGKWGYIDKFGTMVIPAIYDEGLNFENGKANVKLNGRWFYIDRNGNKVK